MRVLVCGGRRFSDREWLYRVLDELLVEKMGIDAVICGAATGADSLAACWGYDRKIKVALFPTEWRRYGNQAGPIRNAQMLRVGQPDIVVAFPGGIGTLDMVTQARAARVEVREVER